MTDSDDRRWWALGGLMLCLLVVGLDTTILNVALPTMSTALHASDSDLQWFSAGCTLVLAAALLPAGMLGDRYGRKRFLLLATAAFAAASAASAYSTSPGMLIAWRAVMGLAAAFLMSLGLAVLPSLFHGRERAKAMAVATTALAAGLPLGPIVGGALLEHFWWGSVFLINVPVGAIALVVAGILLPESHSPSHKAIDVIGVLLSSAGLAGLVYGIIQSSRDGWADPGVIGSLIAGGILIAAFVVWERRTPRPLVDLSLFADPAFLWGTVLTTSMNFTVFGLLFIAPQYLQLVMNNSTLGVGVRLLPLIGGLIVGARAGNLLVLRIGAKSAVASGFAIIGGGLALGATTGATSGYGLVATWFAILGVGMGLVMPTTMDIALGALTPENSGVGSSALNAVRQVGGAFGVALLGSLLNSSYRAGLDTGGLPAAAAHQARRGIGAAAQIAERTGNRPLLDSARHAFAHGLDVIALTCTGVALAGIVAAIVFLPHQSETHESRPESEDELIAL
ncbi:MAG TPA: MFS transporter [Mycobacteriales bacterium]|nr:MFS transporter [Mycobacteriales bacterium]